MPPCPRIALSGAALLAVGAVAPRAAGAQEAEVRAALHPYLEGHRTASGGS